MGLIYVDSCLLIDALADRGDRGERSRRLLLRGEVDDRLVISPMVELECMVRPLRSDNPELVAIVQTALSKFRRIAVTDHAFQLAARLRAMAGFKTPDAIHLAAAGLANCDQFWTTDKQLLRAWPHFVVNPL
ncbi:MAG: PIN domain-containing protein [Solirubrobacterales bacterium]